MDIYKCPFLVLQLDFYEKFKYENIIYLKNNLKNPILYIVKVA